MGAEQHRLTKYYGPNSKEYGENRSAPAAKNSEGERKTRAAGGAPRRGGVYPTVKC